MLIPFTKHKAFLRGELPLLVNKSSVSQEINLKEKQAVSSGTDIQMEYSNTPMFLRSLKMILVS